MDTLVNDWLIRTGGLDVPESEVICLVAETGCRYFASLGFPAPVEAGLRLVRAGPSSITYGIGLFREGEVAPAEEARFVHVCVDRETRRPVPLPERLRAALEALRGER